MQKILSEVDFFKKLDESESGEVYTFCCPYCGENEFTASGLIAHCGIYHRIGGHRVRCPICILYQRNHAPLLIVTLHQHALKMHNEYCTLTNVTTKTQATQECTICIEKIQPNCDIQFLPCSHTFHSECIKAWLRNSATCPVCRVEIDNKT